MKGKQRPVLYQCLDMKAILPLRGRVKSLTGPFHKPLGWHQSGNETMVEIKAEGQKLQNAYSISYSVPIQPVHQRL